MNSDTLAMLKSLDRSTLTDLVRQDQRSPSLELLDWTVEPISHTKIIDTTGGLYRFSGYGRDIEGVKPWSIALKILNDPKGWAQDPRDVFYWKRELLAFQSGLLADIPGGVCAPRCYGVVERDNGGWLWLEHIVETTEQRWSLEQFQLAAYQFGRLGGAYLTVTPLPDDQPWFCDPLFRTIFVDGGVWERFMNPESPENAWQGSMVQRAFTEPLRSAILRILTEKDHFCDVLDRLPQVFCHNDLHRRNLMIRKNPVGQDEVVAVDWAWCGNGALGLDAGVLVADSAHFFDFPPAHVDVLEAAVLKSYVEGLRDVGWSGDERLVRLGYLLTVAMWHGASLPGWTGFMLEENSGIDPIAMYGRSAEEVLAGWVPLAEYLVERADEARHLMHTLNLG